MLTVATLAPPHAPISRIHPMAKLGAAFAVSATALLAVDWFTPALLVLCELAVLPFCGVRFGPLLRRARFLVYTAGTVGVVNTLFDTGDSGVSLLDFGWLEVTSGNVETGASLALRVVAIALPGIVALSTIDPTDLADALIQQLRISPRFAIGALAALRLLPLLGQEWRMITLARRARGIETGRSPVALVKRFGSVMFVLLVGAIRRGTRLALAMDARGFDSASPRSVARPRRLATSDWVILVVAVLACGMVVTASTATGAFTTAW